MQSNPNRTRIKSNEMHNNGVDFFEISKISNQLLAFTYYL